jgi:hypothetical protein
VLGRLSRSERDIRWVGLAAGTRTLCLAGFGASPLFHLHQSCTDSTGRKIATHAYACLLLGLDGDVVVRSAAANQQTDTDMFQSNQQIYPWAETETLHASRTNKTTILVAILVSKQDKVKALTPHHTPLRALRACCFVPPLSSCASLVRWTQHSGMPCQTRDKIFALETIM